MTSRPSPSPQPSRFTSDDAAHGKPDLRVLLITGFIGYGVFFPLIVWVLLEISGAREPASAWGCFIGAWLLVTAPLAVGWRFALTHHRLRQR